MARVALASALILFAAGEGRAATWTYVFTYAQIHDAINAQATAGNSLASVGEYEFFARPVGLTNYTLVSASNTVSTGAAQWNSDITAHPITFSDGFTYAHWIDRTGTGYKTIAMVTDNANVVGKVYSGGIAGGQTGALVSTAATWTVTISSTDPSISFGASVVWNWYASGMQLNANGTKKKYVAETPYTIANSASVPEPGTLGALALGAAVLVYARGRRRRLQP